MSAGVLVYGAIAWVVVNIGLVALLFWRAPGAYRNVMKEDGTYPD